LVGVILAALAALAVETGTLANPDLDELSGLAVSRADPTMLWGHNDTGSGPTLYRIGGNGEDLGSVAIPEARAGDWEDIAAFDDAGGPALLVADTGDNFEWRTFSTLYAIRDPGRARVREARVLWRLDFEFPDGAHDCEAVAVDPIAREILLLTKRTRPSRLYRLPLPDGAPKGRQVADFVGEIAPQPPVTHEERLRWPVASAWIHSPTAFDISADGLTAAIVTLREAYVFRRRRDQSWLALFQQKVPRVRLPDFAQIEAGALTPDGGTLYVGSEHSPAPWARIRIPAR
jgi:hypothetical protein